MVIEGDENKDGQGAGGQGQGGNNGDGAGEFTDELLQGGDETKDAKGVPWKNHVHALHGRSERTSKQLQEAQQQLTQMQARMKLLEEGFKGVGAQGGGNQPAEIDEAQQFLDEMKAKKYDPEIQSLFTKALDATTARMRRTMAKELEPYTRMVYSQQRDSIITKMSASKEYGDAVAVYKDQLIEELDKLPVKAWADETAIGMVLGNIMVKNFSKLKEQFANGQTRIAGPSEGARGGSGGGSSYGISDAEAQEFAAANGNMDLGRARKILADQKKMDAKL